MPKELEIGSHTYVKCLECGYVFLKERPFEAAIAECYPGDYYAHQRPSKRPSLRARLRGRAMQQLGGYTYKKQSWWFELLSGLYTKMIGPHLPVILPVPTDLKRVPRLLDVGCGLGDFIFWAKEAGWSVQGVEISELAVNVARERGFNVFCGTLSEAAFPDEHFDAILFDNSLEHHHDPLSALKEAYRILDSAGSLIVSVPNFGGERAGRFGTFWQQHSVPHHLSLFTPKTLTLLLEKAGFQVSRWKLPSFFLPHSDFRILRSELLARKELRLFILYLKLLWNISIVMKLKTAFGLGEDFKNADFLVAYCRK